MILDNHKDARAIARIEAIGARVLFLPSYSPDFNPIEKIWSKIKAILCRINKPLPLPWMRAPLRMPKDGSNRVDICTIHVEML
ncbi:MAG: transposase [Phycisphaerae bacterium]